MTLSAKTLESLIGNDNRVTGEELRRIMTMNGDGLAAYLGSADHYGSLRLHAMNKAINAHGVERIQRTGPRCATEFAEYLNMGDPYNATLIYWRGRYRVQSLGDFVETMERQGINFK